MRVRVLFGFLLLSMFMVSPSFGDVISGVATLTMDTVGDTTIGDGTHFVTLDWSASTINDSGYFYGVHFSSDTNVAFAADVTSVTQITDAGNLSYTDNTFANFFRGPEPLGSFFAFENVNTHFLGIFQPESLSLGTTNTNGVPQTVTGNWWFQTDGTGDFASALVTDEPSLLSMGLSGALVLMAFCFRRKYQRESIGDGPSLAAH